MKVRYKADNPKIETGYLADGKIYEVEDTEEMDGELYYFVLDEEPDDDGLKDIYPYPAAVFEIIEE